MGWPCYLILTVRTYGDLCLQWLAYFEHVVQSLWNTRLFWCPFLDPHLATHNSNIGVQIIAMFELVTSILTSFCGWIGCNVDECERAWAQSVYTIAWIHQLDDSIELKVSTFASSTLSTWLWAFGKDSWLISTRLLKVVFHLNFHKNLGFRV